MLIPDESRKNYVLNAYENELKSSQSDKKKYAFLTKILQKTTNSQTPVDTFLQEMQEIDPEKTSDPIVHKIYKTLQKVYNNQPNESAKRKRGGTDESMIQNREKKQVTQSIAKQRFSQVLDCIGNANKLSSMISNSIQNNPQIISSVLNDPKQSRIVNQLIQQNKSKELIAFFIEILPPNQLKLQDSDGNTALSLALLEGYENIACQIIHKTTSNDLAGCNFSGNTPLRLAICAGHKEAAKLLIERVDPQTLLQEHWDGGAPVYLAMNKGQEEIACLLIQKLDPEHLSEKNDEDRTLLHIAIEHQFTNAAYLLIEKLNPEQLVQQDIDGNMPIHLIAERHNQKDLAKFLLKKTGIDCLQHLNMGGESPLHIALIRTKLRGQKCHNKELVSFLVKYTPHHIFSIPNFQGILPVASAIGVHDIHTVETLLSMTNSEQLAQAKIEGGSSLRSRAVLMGMDPLVLLIDKRLSKKQLALEKMHNYSIEFVNYGLKKSVKQAEQSLQDTLHNEYDGTSDYFSWKSKLERLNAYIQTSSKLDDLNGLHRIHLFRQQMLDQAKVIGRFMIPEEKDLQTLTNELYNRFRSLSDPNAKDVIRQDDGSTMMGIIGGCVGHTIGYEIRHTQGEYQFVIHNRGNGINDTRIHGDNSFHGGGSEYRRATTCISISKEHITREFLDGLLRLPNETNNISDVYDYITTHILETQCNGKTGVILISPQEQALNECILQSQENSPRYFQILQSLVQENIFESTQAYGTCVESNTTAPEKTMCDKQTYTNLRVFSMNQILSDIYELSQKLKMTDTPILEVGKERLSKFIKEN